MASRDGLQGYGERRRLVALVILGALGLLLGALPVWGTSLDLNAAGSWGAATGTVSYEASSSQSATLTFQLTNTSPAGNGGYMTALVFDVAPEAEYSGFSYSGSGSFDVILDNGKGNSPTKAPPFGTFGLGASSAGQFLGGGNPSSGLPVDGSGTYSFEFSGAGLDNFTVESFLGVESGGIFGALRFRGFDNGESDKIRIETSSGTIIVPEQGDRTAGLLVLGVLPLVMMTRWARTRYSVGHALGAAPGRTDRLFVC